MTTTSSLGEMMIAALARTIEDGSLVFHGFGSPFVQLGRTCATASSLPRHFRRRSHGERGVHATARGQSPNYPRARALDRRADPTTGSVQSP